MGERAPKKRGAITVQPSRTGGWPHPAGLSANDHQDCPENTLKTAQKIKSSFLFKNF